MQTKSKHQQEHAREKIQQPMIKSVAISTPNKWRRCQNEGSADHTENPSTSITGAFASLKGEEAETI